MLEKILSERLLNIFKLKICLNEITEIRLRVNKPIVVFMKNQPYFINESGLTTFITSAIFTTKEMIDEIVFRASDCSLYSINEELKRGYIMLDNGIRIGICGTVVKENENIKTLSNFSSLNIRLPHQVRNASIDIIDEIVSDNGINNTLIVSPPAAGKTTMLRDIIWQFSEKNYCLNVLIVDERGEIAGSEGGKIDLGYFCDVYSYISKYEGIMQGLRSMNPDVIVTDELGDDNDYKALVKAMNSGVNVIASIHARNIEDLKTKKEMQELINTGYFKRYIILSCRNGPGTIEGIFNEKLVRIPKW